MKPIKFLNITKENNDYKKILLNKTKKIINSSQFILGKEVETFENKLKNFLKTKYVIGVSNGTAALYLCLKFLNLKKDDEVLTVSNSYLSTVSTIVLSGAKPVLVDVDESLNISIKDLKKKITRRTKAIIPVHLTGNPCKIKDVIKIAKKNNISVIEDCAQAIGAKYDNKSVGTFGDMGCFSFHPLKNLSALGDAGAIICNSKEKYDWFKKARNNGHPSRDECDFWSLNMRLDTLQASYLNEKIKKLKKINYRRNKNAKIYFKELYKLKEVNLPLIDRKNYSVYHLFMIQAEKRDALIKFLRKKKIETKIHYPKPVHLQKAGIKFFKRNKLKNTEFFAKKILSLPINQYLSKNDIIKICNNIKRFYAII